MDLRTRQNNKLDPAVQEYLEWLSFHWAEKFAEPQNSERQEPSSSSSLSPSPTWWSSSSWDQKLAHMALIWVARRKVVRQKVRKAKLDSRSKKASGNSRRERELQRCPSQLVSSYSMFSLAAFLKKKTHLYNFSIVEVVVVVLFSGFLLAVSRSDSSNCHQRDGRCRHHTCLYALMRTFFSCTAHAWLMFHWHLAQDCQVRARFSKKCHLSTMSVLGVLVGHVPMVASAPTCSLWRPSASSTPLAGTRSLPASLLDRVRMSGCIANPTPDTALTTAMRQLGVGSQRRRWSSRHLPAAQSTMRGSEYSIFSQSKWATGDLPEECRFLLDTQLMFLKKETDSTTKMFWWRWMDSISNGSAGNDRRHHRRTTCIWPRGSWSEKSSSYPNGENFCGNVSRGVS